jgi:hypothetical protein
MEQAMATIAGARTRTCQVLQQAALLLLLAWHCQAYSLPTEL